MDSKLGNRTTTIQMGDIESDMYQVDVGILQGSPLSLILYLFYNADLLETAGDKDIQTTGWIDDVYFFTRSTSAEQNCRNLEPAHQRAETWARKHGSRFSPVKYQLIHFTRSRMKFDVTQTVRIGDTEVKPNKSATYLGIILDPALRWEDQIRHIQKKATPLLKPLATLAGSTWGADLIQLRQIYQAVVLPAILYGCSAWHTLKTDSDHRQSRLRILNQIHTRAMAAMTGAFRATATAALDIETHQIPMKCLLEKRALEALTRIETSQSGDQVRRARGGEAIGSGRIRPGWRPWEWSALERISELAMRRLGQTRFQDLERIQPYITAPYWSPPEVIIAKNTENTIIEHNTITAHSQPVTTIYTDGSGVNGRVGAAAVCPGNVIRVHGRTVRGHSICCRAARDPPSSGHRFTPPNTTCHGLH